MSERSDKRRQRIRPGARPDIDDILKGMNWEARMEDARAKRARVLAAKARFEPGAPKPATFENPQTPDLINEMSDPAPDVPAPKRAEAEPQTAKPEPFVLTRDHAAPLPEKAEKKPTPAVQSAGQAAPKVSEVERPDRDVNHPRPLVAPARFVGRPRPEVEALIAPRTPPRMRRRMLPVLMLGLALGAGAAYLGASRLEPLVASLGAGQATVEPAVPITAPTAQAQLDYPVRAGWPAAPRPIAATLPLPQPLAQTSAPQRTQDIATPRVSGLPMGEAQRARDPAPSRLVAVATTPPPQAEALGALAFAAEPQLPAIAELEPVVPAPDNGTAPVSLPPISLRLSVPTGVSQQTLAEITSALNTAGYQPDSATRVGYAVSQNHVRYYHPEDAEAAVRVAQALGGPARDFTSFSPPPRLGTLEAFLAGSAPQPDQTNPLDDIEAVLQTLFERIQQEDAGANAGN